MKLVKKITIKSVFGDVKTAVLRAAFQNGELVEGVNLPIMRIVGKCSRYEVKTTDIGDSLALKGNFQGINLATGEEFRGGSCYLPEMASEMVAGMLLDEGVEAVEFAFDISAVSDSSTPTGYVYSVTPLMEPQDDDALSRLARSLPALPLLESSDSTVETETVAEAKPAKKK